MTITKEEMQTYIDRCQKELDEMISARIVPLFPNENSPIVDRRKLLMDSMEKAKKIIEDMVTGKIKRAHTLEDYFRRMDEKGIIDHTIRATVWNNKVTFYIHPAMVGGDTVDFEIKENELITSNYMESK